MASCCDDNCGVNAQLTRQRKTLVLVLSINSAMFVVELAAGLYANSLALLADSLDMLGDALVYGFSLYVIAKTERLKALSALGKGVIMAISGLFVLGQAGYRIAVPTLPLPETMGAVGVLALAANGLCLAMLWRHRGDDINMHSVWVCSRNDIIANVSVLGAAVAVGFSGSAWPDIAVGIALSLLFFRSSLQVCLRARTNLLGST